MTKTQTLLAIRDTLATLLNANPTNTDVRAAYNAAHDNLLRELGPR